MPKHVPTTAVNLIVQLLNRNPTKRLGSGPDGVLEIMRHPFFDGVDWINIIAKKTKPQPPKLRIAEIDKLYRKTELTDKAIDSIFEDQPDGSDSTRTNKNIDGWSFI